MKKLKYIVLVFIVFLILFVISLNFDNYKISDSLVFVESLNPNYGTRGMGFVYNVERDTSYIITNYHVIENGNELYIYNLDNKKARASVIDYDKYTDIAILSIEDSLDLKEVKISNEDVKLNDEVFYFNIEKNTIESGTVLSLDDKINLTTDYGNSFYNAGSINGNIERGNSGGALFNSNDEAIGLISLKEQNQNIGFYIPINYVIDIVTKLENHTLIRPNLGGKFANTTNTDILNEYSISVSSVDGVVALEVTNDYPLDVAGIIKGDVITKVNNTVIGDVNDLQTEIYSYNIGDTVILGYYRGNAYNEVNIILNK